MAHAHPGPSTRSVRWQYTDTRTQSSVSRYAQRSRDTLNKKRTQTVFVRFIKTHLYRCSRNWERPPPSTPTPWSRPKPVIKLFYCFSPQVMLSVVNAQLAVRTTPHWHPENSQPPSIQTWPSNLETPSPSKCLFQMLPQH